MTGQPGTNDGNKSGDPIDVVGYVRVSTEEQADSGLGLEAQKAKIQAHARVNGWRVVEWVEDTISARGGKNLKGEQFKRALELLEDGGPDVLVVAKLDRLARSTVGFGKLLERAQDNGWSVIAIDHGLDMTTANGRLVAEILASIAQWESDKISERTQEALQAKKKRGERVGGKRVPAHVRKRIVSMKENGATQQTIADELNRDEVPTARGGEWRQSTISGVLNSVGYGEDE